MRSALLTVVLGLGCVTAPVTTSSSASVSDPEGKPCLASDVCGASTCVKAVDAGAGVCSQLPSGAACRVSSDCPAGSFCHRPVGFNGVCFKP